MVDAQNEDYRTVSERFISHTEAAIPELSSESGSESPSLEESEISETMIESLLIQENKKKRESLLQIIRQSEINAKIKPEDYEKYIINAERKTKIDLLKKNREEIENQIQVRVASIENYELQMRRIIDNIEKTNVNPQNPVNKIEEMKKRREEFQKKQQETSTTETNNKLDQLKKKFEKKTEENSEEKVKKPAMNNFFAELEQKMAANIAHLENKNLVDNEVSKKTEANDPKPISLAEYKENLKASVKEKDNGKVVTSSGKKVNSSLADKVAMLDNLFGKKRNSKLGKVITDNNTQNEKIGSEGLTLDHLLLERVDLPKKKHKKKNVIGRKRVSKEW